MSRLTQALVATTRGKLELQNIYLESLREDEVLVEIHAVGICHADISCLNGVLPVPFPIVLGHEGRRKFYLILMLHAFYQYQR
jgi:Zn-dependent alcohol dehydrogenase